MEGAAVAEGLWGLADHHQKLGEIGKTIKCLEAICQSQISFLPLVEVKSRLRVSSLLLRYTHNVNHAKFHLERSLLLLKSIPSSFNLKFQTYSLLSHCYHLLASFPSQRNLLLKALEIASSVPQDISAHLWSCNFNSQLANTYIIQADFSSSLSALESGFLSASHICFPELQMFFTASMLHVHIMQWTNDYSVEKAVQRCDEIWQTISSVSVCYSTKPGQLISRRLIAALVCSSTMKCCIFSIASGSVIIRPLSITSTVYNKP